MLDFGRNLVRLLNSLILIFLLSVSATYANSIYKCTTGHGGYVDTAKWACDHSPPRHFKGRFASADTLGLCVPGSCVDKKSIWYFHGSTIDTGISATGARSVVPIMSPRGNSVLMECYSHYPLLEQYILQHHILDGVKLFPLTGEQLGQMGVPVCKRK